MLHAYHAYAYDLNVQYMHGNATEEETNSINNNNTATQRGNQENDDEKKMKLKYTRQMPSAK